MKKRGLYNEFSEEIGWVDYDGNCYYNGHLYGHLVFDSLTPSEFWDWINELGLWVGSF